MTRSGWREHVSDIRAGYADPTPDVAPLQGFHHFCWPMTQGGACACPGLSDVAPSGLLNWRYSFQRTFAVGNFSSP
jgi:hypothetical protein